MKLGRQAAIIAGALPAVRVGARAARFRHDVAHAFEVAACFIEFAQRVLALVAMVKCRRLLRIKRGVLRVEGQGLIDQTLTDDGVGAARETGLGESSLISRKRTLLPLSRYSFSPSR